MQLTGVDETLVVEDPKAFNAHLLQTLLQHCVGVLLMLKGPGEDLAPSRVQRLSAKRWFYVVGDAGFEPVASSL